MTTTATAVAEKSIDAAPVTVTTADRIDAAVMGLTQVLSRYSVHLLRISLGLVFLGFGALKFFPGASPAEDLAVATIDKLSFGIVGGSTALLITAILECFIGLTLVTGKLLKVGLVVLAGAMAGIMAPLVIFFGDMFPGGLPTLEAQYVLKDIILVAAATVVAAHALGARLIPMRDSSR